MGNVNALSMHKPNQSLGRGGNVNLYRKLRNPATSNLKWPPFAFAHSWASVSTASSSFKGFCSPTRRLVLANHSFTWQSRANASLIHSIHTNTFNLFTRIHSFHSRASWPLSIKQFLGICIFRTRVLVVLEKARKFQEYHNLYGAFANSCTYEDVDGVKHEKHEHLQLHPYSPQQKHAQNHIGHPMLFHASVTPLSFSYQLVYLCIGKLIWCCLSGTFV